MFAATTSSLASKYELEVDFFDDSATTSSLMCKHEQEVIFSALLMRLPPPPPPPSHPNVSRRWLFLYFNATLPTTTSLTSKCELEVEFFNLSTRLLPPPPLSHPNASRRWNFSAFQRICHHLPHSKCEPDSVTVSAHIPALRSSPTMLNTHTPNDNRQRVRSFTS